MEAREHLPAMYCYDERAGDLYRTFKIAFSPVPDRLRPFVECIVCNRTSLPGCSRIPEGIGHVVFLVARWHSSKAFARKIAYATLLFSGPHSVKRPMPLGSGETIVAQLRPGAARAVFGLPAHALANRIVSAEAVRGMSARHALECIATAPTSRARLAVFTAMLSAWVRPSTADDTFAVTAAAWMQRSHDWRAGTLVAKSGYSERQTRRKFEDCLGLSPKAFARTLRLHAVLTLAARNAELSEIAAETGYCDQSHLTHDFRACLGRTPASFFLDRGAAVLSRFGIVIDPAAASPSAAFTNVAPTGGTLLKAR